MSSQPLSLDAMRVRARALHTAGHLPEATQLQVELIKAAVQAHQVNASDYHRLGVMLFAQKDFAAAVRAFEHTRQHQADYPGVVLNLGLSRILAGQPGEAIPELLSVIKELPESLDALAGLAHAYGKLGDLEQARLYGEQSLLAKDGLVKAPPPGFKLPSATAPPFRSDHARENVIAFSLFGDNERYTRGAVKNAALAGEIYPGWHCRYYCDDTVPVATRTALVNAGAEVELMPRLSQYSDGLFWRFLVMDDPAVVRFIIRDCDSVINMRERRAVDEWIESGRLFHVMRDNPAHTDLILAGMWGGVARQLPPFTQLVQGFVYNPVTESRTVDQLFLGRIVWPMIKNHCLIHDSLFRVFGAKDFPEGAEFPHNRRVGDNDAAFQ